MKTTVYFSDTGYDHQTPHGHPERAERLDAVKRALDSVEGLERAGTREATREELQRAHSKRHVDYIFDTAPAGEPVALDADTWMSPGSLSAARHACGGAILGVDAVMEADGAAFIACRPPGHHAEPDRAMGFCLFNQLAVAAAHALDEHEVSKIAVVDFDVHHGNGTQAYAETEPRLFFGSIHQGWIYPGTGAADETGDSDNICNVPVDRATAGAAWREALEESIFSRVSQMAPDIIFVSAGFDGHRDDPLAGLELSEADYAWAGERLAALAQESAHPRLVCTLEGGYDIEALEKSVAAFLRAIAAA